MKKIIIAAFLLSISNGAMAEWTWMGDSDSAKVYIDLSTIRKNGNLVKMWMLNDFHAMQKIRNHRFLSNKIQYEYNCKEERLRSFAMIEFSGNMGSGDVIYRDFYPKDWSPVSPESIGEAAWKVACGSDF